jgi:hypothetical protein
MIAQSQPLTSAGESHTRSGGRRLALIGTGALLALGLSACGAGVQGSAGSGASATPTTEPSASASATPNTAATRGITGAFVRFFDGNTPVDTRVDLLQNGQQYAQLLQAESRLPAAKNTSAQVSDVRVNGQQATVTYSVLINGNTVLQNQTGTAVLVDGQWKVGDQTFCHLLSVQGLPNQQCSVPASGSHAPTPTS